MALTTGPVWITRDEPADGPLSALLLERGVPSILAPLVRIRPVGDGRDHVRRLGTEDWLVLTSPRAVELVTDEVLVRRPRIAVAGESSASAARSRGFDVELISPSASSAGIWDHLRAHAGGRRVCFARSRRAEPPSDPPFDLEVVDLYDVIATEVSASEIERATAVAFTSRSAVESCVRCLGSVPLPAFSIGPSTTGALLDAGAGIAGEASSRTLASLADRVSAWHASRT